MNTLENIRAVALPKGSNREAATDWLNKAGFEVPDFPGSLLHRRCKFGAVSTFA